ncbi:MAG: hypothetical protein RMY34_21460 [Aulosira sp. DedQUE10]|nr:hypothetical protein [Aulosira sp. DedQUE10]
MGTGLEQLLTEKELAPNLRVSSPQLMYETNKKIILQREGARKDTSASNPLREVQKINYPISTSNKTIRFFSPGLPKLKSDWLFFYLAVPNFNYGDLHVACCSFPMPFNKFIAPDYTAVLSDRVVFYSLSKSQMAFRLTRFFCKFAGNGLIKDKNQIKNVGLMDNISKVNSNFRQV